MLLVLLILVMVVMLAGATLAALSLRGRTLPLPVSSLHGIAGIGVIVLLILHDLHFPHNIPANAAAAVLVLTATGGLLLFGFRAGRQTLPGLMVGLHAAFAGAALLLLIIAYLHS